jgi:hypothetical protein
MPEDVLPPTRDIGLGANWFPVEGARENVFRWCENDGIINVAVLEPYRHVLRLVIEPGPGVGSKAFTLTAGLAGEEALKTVRITGKEVVRIELPPDHPRAYSILLHADGGGSPSPGDPRILNFRLFEAAIERYPDVLPAWATPTKGFYPLESYANSMFRWVSNDAVVVLHATKRGAELSFEVEPGAGLDEKPFLLHVRRPGGDNVLSEQIAARTRVRVPMAGLGEVDRLTLHVDGGGKVLANDPRILNFRIFAAS